ncbi:uncharacterized protein BDR25DRAFT_285984 [Lindgomyces ingoldianus]|uniref:Uncharacterized protein n=1 Tax=Lindgomyces ingoldianus TaxID=673940 RepID=A0ACB6QXZ3_9PLEO|nr:uncharacterized protein BDR25DRAFT_285984 [Lindgomyces ingoldianus]KAF2471400.1 hypothetical protein BDR25DRAFT_285984 [Lindgomyces ingoldianus]
MSAHPHHLHLHHTGKRLRHFFRPDGRKVHIAGSPDEAEKLRKTLSAVEKEGEFDLVIHGSPEHIEALRHTHAHHESRHRQLKEEHGDLANEFERVIRELDALSNELHMISEHAVQLDANFSKYGYSAHLRTKDSPNESRAASLHGDSSFDKNQWAAERKLGETMRLYQKPIVRQYFHKGLLWRAREAQEVASYELFVDLFYVGIIAITGDTAAEHPTGESLLRFVITFVMGWKFWSDISALIGWFDSDDILRRFSILFILTCLLGFTTNMAAAFTETYAPLVAFYLAARLFIAVSIFWYAWQIPMVRASMIANGIINAVPAALWIGSIHVEEPGRQALIWPAIFLDIFGPPAMITFQRGAGWMSEKFHAWAKKKFEFFPGTNIEHRIERMNAFVTLVFGSCVLGLLYQSKVPFGINAFFGKAALGLIQAFTFNWLYFEIDSFNLHTHAIRRHVASAMIWLSIHLPFIMSFVLSASALAVLVRAHDCEDAPVDSLYETFIPRSEEHIEDSLRWFYCGGLGISLACMSVISYTHVYRSIPNRRLGKNKCILIRFLVSIAIILLPLAKEHLNSLELIATTTCLVLFVLFLELIGSTLTGQNILWDAHCGRNKCKYDAKCQVSKKDLEASIRNGTVLNVEEIAKRDKGENGAIGHI